jgi:hypothetical protein
MCAICSIAEALVNTDRPYTFWKCLTRRHDVEKCYQSHGYRYDPRTDLWTRRLR